MSLPSAGSNFGSDEVRAADGTTCRSSMSGNGAKFDMGAIGAPDYQNKGSFAALYGRIVVPLGPKLRRVDCYSLYQLELERLKHELEMAKGTGGDVFSDEEGGSWANEGWSDGSSSEEDDGQEISDQADETEMDAEVDSGAEVESDVESDAETESGADVENDASVDEQALAPVVPIEPLGYMPETVEQWSLRGMMD